MVENNNNSNSPSTIINGMDYCGMLNWTVETGTSYLSFINALEMIRSKNCPRVLEVGTFAGTSIATIARLFPGSKCYAIDNWSLSENEIGIVSKVANEPVNMGRVRDAFFSNTKGLGITLIEKTSSTALSELISSGIVFDFIYVDGSHGEYDVLTDLTLAWCLLRSGGVLGIDDYLWNPCNGEKSPKAAIDHFIAQNIDSMVILSKGYRIFLYKQ